MSKTEGYLSNCPNCKRELTFYSEDGKKWRCVFCHYEKELEQ